MSLNAKSYLFDAGIISLFYAGDKKVKPYFDRVFASHAKGIISEVNLAEFYYKAASKKGIEVADLWYRQIRQSSFRIIPPDESITREAGLLKLKNGSFSLADCFAVATAQKWAEALLTTDSDLKSVKGVKVVVLPLK